MLVARYAAKTIGYEVGAEGIEPSCSEAAGFKPAVSTGFTTRPDRDELDGASLELWPGHGAM